MKSLLFDLDGMLVDTVYAHVFAWQRALAEAGLPIGCRRIHSRIGMSGALFTRAVVREAGHAIADDQGPGGPTPPPTRRLAEVPI
jgi:beta-phosphoglucomutase-like phosphatase (HAD superfamily)